MVMEEVQNAPAPGGGAQEFCLRWNNFHSSLATSLDIFKNEKDFVDVTLACEGQQVHAHRMLLSACSIYFRDLIKANPCPHPIIILPTDVKYTDLDKLLHFMYQGEVNVLQENLARFLKTAEMLKVRGLADDDKKSLQPVQPVHPVHRVGSPCSSNSSTITPTPTECGTSPKRPRLSIDSAVPTVQSTPTNTCASSTSIPLNNVNTTNNSFSSSSNNNNTTTTTVTPSAAVSSLSNDTPNTPTNPEDSTHSANDSDSEMLPVKQEMVELKSCDEFETDNEPFNPEAYLKEGVILTTEGGGHSHPPPPGALRPSYIPPPPIKPQEDSTASSNGADELSQEYDYYSESEDPNVSFCRISDVYTRKTPDQNSDTIPNEEGIGTSISWRRTGPNTVQNEEGGYVTCPHCCKLITSYNLNRHIRMVHMTMEKATCFLCQKIFKNKYSLSTHLHRQHHDYLQNLPT